MLLSNMVNLKDEESNIETDPEEGHLSLDEETTDEETNAEIAFLKDMAGI